MAGKRKRLTNREKRENAQIKKELQEKGIIPPDKKPLNRKGFIEEAKREWDSRGPGCYIWEAYLCEAATWVMTGTEGRTMRSSLEAVGAAKVIKIALRLREFSKKLEAEGRDTYKIVEKYEYIKDILEA